MHLRVRVLKSFLVSPWALCLPQAWKREEEKHFQALKKELEREEMRRRKEAMLQQEKEVESKNRRALAGGTGNIQHGGVVGGGAQEGGDQKGEVEEGGDECEEDVCNSSSPVQRRRRKAEAPLQFMNYQKIRETYLNRPIAQHPPIPPADACGSPNRHSPTTSSPSPAVAGGNHQPRPPRSRTSSVHSHNGMADQNVSTTAEASASTPSPTPTPSDIASPLAQTSSPQGKGVRANALSRVSATRFPTALLLV